MINHKNNKAIRTIFMGTPEFALPGLKALLASPDFDLVAVFTQPDRPSGRHQKPQFSPVKQIAVQNKIPLYQPVKIRDYQDEIANLAPELIIVIAYGKIIPASILAIPQHGCVNVHGSLLPKYRGAACVNAPILNGDEKTGITIMLMDETMDTGPIIAQFEIPLTETSTFQTVHDDLAHLGGENLVPTLKAYLRQELIPQAQDDSQASYVSLIKKEMGKIDWQLSATQIERQIRAYHPWPGSFTYTKDNRLLKIHQAQVLLTDDEAMKPGQVFLNNNNLAIKCGQNSLLILNLQLEGAKALSAKDFLSGHQEIIGQTLQ